MNISMEEESSISGQVATPSPPAIRAKSARLSNPLFSSKARRRIREKSDQTQAKVHIETGESADLENQIGNLASSIMGMQKGFFDPSAQPNVQTNSANFVRDMVGSGRFSATRAKTSEARAGGKGVGQTEVKKGFQAILQRQQHRKIQKQQQQEQSLQQQDQISVLEESFGEVDEQLSNAVKAALLCSSPHPSQINQVQLQAMLKTQESLHNRMILEESEEDTQRVAESLEYPTLKTDNSEEDKEVKEILDQTFENDPSISPGPFLEAFISDSGQMDSPAPASSVGPQKRNRKSYKKGSQTRNKIQNLQYEKYQQKTPQIGNEAWKNMGKIAENQKNHENRDVSVCTSCTGSCLLM